MAYEPKWTTVEHGTKAHQDLVDVGWMTWTIEEKDGKRVALMVKDPALSARATFQGPLYSKKKEGA